MKTMNKFQGLLLGVLVLMFTGCKEEEPINVTPTVVTGDVSEVYRKGATISGMVQNPYGATIKECGILISDFESMAEAKEYRSETPDASTFAVSTTSLTPGKTYYYSAYASSGASMVQGSVKNFTTPESNAPVLSEMNVSGIDEKSVSLSVEILDNGGSELELAGFCWKEGNSGDPTALDNVQNIKPQGNTLMGTIPGLEPNKNYRIRAYAVSSSGVGYSQTINVTTNSAVIPFLGAVTATDVTDFTASVSAQIIDSGSSAPTKIGFCWSTETNQPTVSHFSVEVNDQLGNSTFSVVISELTPETTYYIRAFATNEQGTGYSESVQITTTKSLTLSYVGTTEITSHSAFFRTETNYEGIAVPQRVGFCWSTNAGKLSLENAEFTADATWNGNVFECKAEELAHLTDYYVRPFFVSTLGRTYYGETQSFATGDKGIYTKEDLIAFRDERNNYRDISFWKNSEGIIKFYSDIDLSSIDNWQPIESIGENEVFDGNGHTIKGVKRYYEFTTYGATGFIRFNRGTIKNLTVEAEVNWTMGTLENSYSSYIAGICGANYDVGRIDNCVFKGSIIGKNATYDSQTYATGICGDNNGNITQCKNYANITNGTNISGICGYNFRGVINDCDNYGTISCNENFGEVSGITAYNYGENALVSDCCNYGNLIGGVYNTPGQPRIVSGIVQHNFSEVKNCTNEGSITGNYAVGIVECNYGTIDNCTNKGTLSCGNGDFSGSYGICSHNYNIVRNCVNESNIVGKNEAAGIVAYNYATLENYYPIVDNCTNKGNISAETYAAGIVVRCEGNTTNFTVQNCTNTGNIVGGVTYTGGIIGFINTNTFGTYSNNTNGGTVNGEPATESNAIGYDARE